MIARFQRSAGDVADLRVGRLRLVAITPEKRKHPAKITQG